MWFFWQNEAWDGLRWGKNSEVEIQTKKVNVVCCTLHSIKSGLTQESAFQNQVQSIPYSGDLFVSPSIQ